MCASDPGVEEIPHTADYAFRVRASTPAELLERCGDALYGLAGLEGLTAAGVEKEIHLAAPDLESLLVTWLNELVWLLDDNRMILRNLVWSECTDTALRVSGKPECASRQQKAIKAATYSGIRVARPEGGYEVTVVLDV